MNLLKYSRNPEESAATGPVIQSNCSIKTPRPFRVSAPRKRTSIYLSFDPTTTATRPHGRALHKASKKAKISLSEIRVNDCIITETVDR